MDNNIYYNIPNIEFKEQRKDMKLFNYDNNDISPSKKKKKNDSNDISITNFPLISYTHNCLITMAAQYKYLALPQL